MAQEPLPPISVDTLRQILDAHVSLASGALRTAGPAAADALIATMSTSNFIAPFDWQAFIATLGRPADDPAVLQDADLDTIRRLMTAHVRTDRFVGGHLDRLTASGYIDTAMTRLRELLTAGQV